GPADRPGDTAANPGVDRRSYQITPDGAFAVFTTESNVMLTSEVDRNGTFDVFRRDLLNTVKIDPTSGAEIAEPAALQLVSVNFRNSKTTPTAAGGQSLHPVITPNGRLVAFDSTAGDIVTTGVDTNKVADVYVRDLQSTRDTKGNLVVTG